jgi:hypothetical protein
MNKLYENIKNLKIRDLVKDAQIKKGVANRILFQTRERGGSSI